MFEKNCPFVRRHTMKDIMALVTTKDMMVGIMHIIAAISFFVILYNTLT